MHFLCWDLISAHSGGSSGCQRKLKLEYHMLRPIWRNQFFAHARCWTPQDLMKMILSIQTRPISAVVTLSHVVDQQVCSHNSEQIPNFNVH